MKPVKITVLRMQMYEDLAKEFLTEGVCPCDFYTGGAALPLHRRGGAARGLLSLGVD